MKHKTAVIIGNGGIGDSIVCVGMINYLATKYENVIVACVGIYYEQIKKFYDNCKIKIYNVSQHNETLMEFDIMMRSANIYDIYAFGHYGYIQINYNSFIKRTLKNNEQPIIYNYPVSFYDDVNIPINIMRDYFHVNYPDNIIGFYNELLEHYPTYRVIHQNSSDISMDIIKLNHLSIDNYLTINVNNNAYKIGHKYHDIAQKFIRLPSLIYYSKLIENANELYLIDSCVHALALTIDVSHANKKICYKREPRFDYAFGKFTYIQIGFAL